MHMLMGPPPAVHESFCPAPFRCIPELKHIRTVYLMSESSYIGTWINPKFRA